MGHSDADDHYGLIHGTLESLLKFAETIPGWKEVPSSR